MKKRMVSSKQMDLLRALAANRLQGPIVPKPMAAGPVLPGVASPGSRAYRALIIADKLSKRKVKAHLQAILDAACESDDEEKPRKKK
jgi:hypothetical protein